MAEIISDVFDIFHPTPVPLRELSAIVISLEIWRCEINKYRSSDTWKEFLPYKYAHCISSKTMIPDLPSTIYPVIDKYVKIFGHSMSKWLWRHYVSVFRFKYDNKNSVLEYFEDFVCDYDGGIHYARTAERMMHCDQFNPDQKFLIACSYCFEDNIRQIYPFVSSKPLSSYNNFVENPLFTYWILFLESPTLVSESIEEWVFDESMPHNGLSLDYFWNCVPPEKRLQKSIDIFIYDLLESFVRYILPKLDHQQLDEFLNEKGCELMHDLLKSSTYDEEFVLRTWAYVKSAMNEIAFTNLIVKMMQSEVSGYVRSGLDKHWLYWVQGEYLCDSRDLENFLQLCIEIWNTAAENLKRSAVRDITSNNELFEDIYKWRVLFLPSTTSRDLKFLLAVLSYATYEQRNAFWHNSWQYLIKSTSTDSEDFRTIMKLCLRDENGITEFKKNIMANDEDTTIYSCGMLLSRGCFDELNHFVRFFLPEIQAARNFIQQLLQSEYLGDGSCHFNEKFIQKPEEFDEFISEAYNDVDLSTNFKNQLMSSPSIRNEISARALYVPIKQFIEFIDLFVSSEEILLQLKTHIIEYLKKKAAFHESKVPKSSFASLLSWCLEDEEQVSKFILTYVRKI